MDSMACLVPFSIADEAILIGWDGCIEGEVKNARNEKRGMREEENRLKLREC